MNAVALMPSRGRGLRQRLGLNAASEGNGRRSRLGSALSAKFRSGVLRASEISELAASASGDNASPDIKKLAGAESKKRRLTDGGSRPDTRNASRGVRRAMRQHRSLPDPYYFQCPLWNKHLGRITFERVAILLPTDLVASYIPVDRAQIFCEFGPSEDGYARELRCWSQRVGTGRMYLITKQKGCELVRSTT